MMARSSVHVMRSAKAAFAERITWTLDRAVVNRKHGLDAG